MTLAGMWGVPARNCMFTGRENQLKALYDKFFDERATGKSPRSALPESLGNQRNSGIKRTELRGIGGVGKTQLSVEYCHRHFGSKYGFVVMIRAESQASVAQDMRRLALDLGILGNDSSSNSNGNSNSSDSGVPAVSEVERLKVAVTPQSAAAASSSTIDSSSSNKDKNRESGKGQSSAKTLLADIDDDEVMEIIKRKLSRCRFRWLIVFDNVEDFSVISKYLPRGQLNDQFTPMSSAAVLSTATAARYTMDRELDLESPTTELPSWVNTGDDFDSQGGGHVIITSRTSHSSSNNYFNSHSIHNGANMCDPTNMRHSPSAYIVLECFDKAESMRFLDSSLLQSATDSTANASQMLSTPSSSSSLEARSLSALADRMGHLPLALAMASAYLTRCDVTASEYLTRLDKLTIYEDMEGSEEVSDTGYDDDSDGREKSDTDESQGACNLQGTENDAIQNTKHILNSGSIFKGSNDSHDDDIKVVERKKIKNNVEALAERKSRRRGRDVNMVGANDYSVVSSLSISLDRIQAESQAAYTVLLLLGFLSPDGITKVLVRRLLEIGYLSAETSSNLLVCEVHRNKSDQNLVMSGSGLVDVPNTAGDGGDGGDGDSVHDSSCLGSDGALPVSSVSFPHTHSDTYLLSLPSQDIRVGNHMKKSTSTLHASMSCGYSVKSLLACTLILALMIWLLPPLRINLLSFRERKGVMILSCFALYGIKRFVDDVIAFTDAVYSGADGAVGAGAIEGNAVMYEGHASEAKDAAGMVLSSESDDVHRGREGGSASRQAQLIENQDISSPSPSHLKGSEGQNQSKKMGQSVTQNMSQNQPQSEENTLRETDRVWELLKQFSLLSVRGGRGNRVGSIHRLQQSVLRSRIFMTGGAKNVRSQLEKCIYAINCMWQFNIKDSDTWEECGSLLNHIQSLVSHVRQYPLTADVARRFSVILTQAASYSTEVLSRFDYAQYLLESAVLIQSKISESKVITKAAENESGDKDKGTLFPLLEEKADVMHLLGKVLRIRGDFSKAERSLETALNMRKKTKSRKICDTFHELGVLSLRHHEYSIAFQYLTDSLKLKRSLRKEFQHCQHAGNGSKQQLNTRNGRSDGALDMIMTETSEAATLHQLAVIATGEGSYDDAELLLLEALVLESTAESGVQLSGAEGGGVDSEGESGGEGNDDIDSKVDLNVIAELMKADGMQGDGSHEASIVCALSGPSLEKHGDKEVSNDMDSAQQHKKKQYKPKADSSSSSSSTSSIISEKRLSTLRKIVKMKAKLAALQNAESKVRAAGNDTRKPRTSVSRAATLQQLGRVALRTGRLGEAEIRFKDSLSLYHAAYGAEKSSRHINVAAVYHQLGCCFSAMHDFSEASKHFNSALATREMIYGNSLYSSPESGSRYNDNDDNNSNSDYGGMSQCTGSDCGSIEIIQEIQALGQSELMVGKLISAQKLFLRQFDMCLRSLNLKVITVNNEMVIQSNSDADRMDDNNDVSAVESSSSNEIGPTGCVGDDGVSGSTPQQGQKESLSISLPTPFILPSPSALNLPLPELLSSATSLRRKQDSLIRFLLFSVYSLKSICNREKNSCGAAEYARLARVIRRMLLQGKRCSQDAKSHTDTTSTNCHDDKNNGKNDDNQTTGADTGTACATSTHFMESVLHQTDDTDNTQKNILNQAITSNQVFSCLLAPKLMKSRDEVRALTILVSKGKHSHAAIHTMLSVLQCLELYLSSSPSTPSVPCGVLSDGNTEHRAPYNVDGYQLNGTQSDMENPQSGSQGDWDNYILEIGLNYARSCHSSLAQILEVVTSQTASTCDHLAGPAVTPSPSPSPSDNRLQSHISSLFVTCDTLRLQLRKSGLHIEDSRA
jgi:tetratricopeptide (TPR) repeat protein